MRLIENEMLEAIKHGRDWSQDNTKVVVDESYRSYLADVYLHGNHIARVWCRIGCDDRVIVNTGTLKHYPTRTTMSRLRALGVNVCTRRGEVLLDGKPI